MTRQCNVGSYHAELKFEDWQPREVRTQKQQDVVLYPENDDYHLPQWPSVAPPKLNLMGEDHDDDYQLAVVQVNPAIYTYDSSAELAKLQGGTKADSQSSKHQRESPTLPETPQEDFRPPSFSENTSKSVYRVQGPKPTFELQAMHILKQDTKVFDFDSDHYKKLQTVEEQAQEAASFSPIKEDTQRIVFGDPNSEQKLKFLEKIQSKNRAASVFPDYDSLAAPPPQPTFEVVQFQYSGIPHEEYL